MLKKVFHTVGVFHVVVAVVCIIIGVVVEFHQVHIYKNNISFWQIQATKAASKDTKKYIAPAKFSVTPIDIGFDNFGSIEAGATDVMLKISRRSIFARQHFDLITHEYNNLNILRGPPML